MPEKHGSIDSLFPPTLSSGKVVGKSRGGSLTGNEQLRELLGWAGRCCRLERFARQIEVEWNYRFTACLGRATFRGNKIELAAKLWHGLDDEERVEAVVHEACHLFAYEKHVRRGNERFLRGQHGPEWLAMMAACGYPESQAQRSAPIPSITPEYLVYCQCRKHFITPQMLGRMKKGARLYCPDCGSDATLTPYADEER